jgi:tetratricopeptide (TPR) repeat protein
MQWVRELSPATRPQIVEFARELIARRPDKVTGWLALASALVSSGEFGEALASLAEATPRFPADPDLQYWRARALEDLGDLEQALDAAEDVLRLKPDHRDARTLRSRVTVQLAVAGRSSRELGHVASAADDNDDLSRWRLTALFRDGATEELLRQCDCRLEQRPGDTCATYFKAMALADLGRGQEARSLVSVERFVEVAMLATPAGFASGEAFRDSLAAELSTNRHFVNNPRGKATRAGSQTNYVRASNTPAVEALLEQIKAQVEAYLVRLGDCDDGFVKARPDTARLDFWAVASEAEGHQAPHYHAIGWMSGVFYVDAPRVGDTYRGPLVLGAVDAAFEPPWGLREIEPTPGRIVLFPAYVPHATRPPRVEGRRLIVAFNVIPHQVAEGRTVDREVATEPTTPG